MKIIEKIQIWQNGTTVEANRFSVMSASDNLSSAASFQYTLYADDMPVQNGGIAIGGQDYEDWNAEPDVNTWAYNWVAGKLNITILGDYVPPVIEEPVVEQKPIIEEEQEPIIDI